MLKHIAVASLTLIAVACADKPETIIVSGNGSCHPSQALPEFVTVETVRVRDIDINDAYALLVDARTALGNLAREYNTLYRECVGQKK